MYEWLSGVFQDQSGVLQRVDVLQTGTCPGEYGLSCRGKVESGGVRGGSEELRVGEVS